MKRFINLFINALAATENDHPGPNPLQGSSYTYSKDSKKRCLVNWSKNRAALVYTILGTNSAVSSNTAVFTRCHEATSDAKRRHAHGFGNTPFFSVMAHPLIIKMHPFITATMGKPVKYNMRHKKVEISQPLTHTL